MFLSNRRTCFLQRKQWKSSLESSYIPRFSTKEYKNLQGGDKALTWEVLKECMNSKCKLYDFGGVKKNSQPGIFNFKRGFGGEHILASDYKVMLTL